MLLHLFNKFIAATLRKPKTTLFVAVLLTAVGFSFGLKLELRSNFSDLLPENHPAVLQARRLSEVVGGSSFVVVAVETEVPEAAGRFIDDLHQAVQDWEEIRYIDDRPPVEFLRRQSLLFLDVEDLEELKTRTEKKIEQVKLEKAGLYVNLEEEGEGDAFYVHDLQKKYGTYIQPNSYYQNSEGTLFVSLIKPQWRSTNVGKTERFVSRLDTVVAKLQPVSYHPSLRIQFTGPYIKQMRQQKILLKDATTVSLIALVGAIVYLTLHFRRKRAVFLIGLPLAVSVSWALVLAYFFFGSLNLFSSVVCAIMLGLATDYGIHIYSEYIRHRGRGESVEAALLHAVDHLRNPFFIAATTTATAFFALGLSRFKAFHELGLIAGPGIMLCGLAFVVLFPALTLLMERISPQHIEKQEEAATSDGWLRRLPRFFTPRTAMVCGGFLLLPLLSIPLGGLYFDYDLNNIMAYQSTKALDHRVDEIFNDTVNPEVALVERAEDAAALASALRQVKKRHSQTPEGTTIDNVISFPDFLPGQQSEKIAKIQEIKSLLTDDVVEALNEKDRENYESFQGMLQPSPMTVDDLPSQIMNKFRDRQGGIGRVVFIFPNFEMAQSDRFMRFVEEVRETRCTDCQGPFYASGEATIFYEIIRLLFSEGKYLIGFVLIAIFILLWANFRSLQAALLAFAPLFVGLLSCLGWMGVLGIPFNIINLGAILIILGIVVDYVVHLYQRYRDHPEQSLSESYLVTFRPILGSAITTLIGFGALLFADNGGVRSVGLLTSLGIVTGMVSTLFWFPAFLAALQRSKAATKTAILYDNL